VIPMPRTTDEVSTVVATPASTTIVRESQRDRVLLVGLAVCSGLVEAWSLCSMNCYANMMTGNTVRFLASLSLFEWRGVALYGSLVASYCAGSALSRILTLRQSAALKNRQDDTRKGTSKTNTDATIYIQASYWAMGLFVAADLLTWYRQSRTVALPLMALAFGMINSVTTQRLGVTNAVTGHWTRLSQGLVDAWTAARALDQDLTKGRSKKYYMSEAARNSRLFLSVFCSSLLIGTGVAHRVYRSTSSPLPPLVGVSLGLAYVSIFRWYRNDARRDDIWN